MSSDAMNVFNKENLDTYLKDLAKQFRKNNGKNAKAEIVLVGGAAILVNYSFRDMTTDIDAIIHTNSSMIDAINQIGDKYNLPRGWINSDFMRTDSYSSKLIEFSVYYKTLSGVVEIRSISSEYLVAMKLKSGRKFKNDMSDIIGILKEHEKRGQPILWDMLEKAVFDLYGNWNAIPSESVSFIRNALSRGDYENVYLQTKGNEQTIRMRLLDFQKKYPNTVNQSNVESLIGLLESNDEDQNKK